MLHELLFALNGFPGSIFVQHERKIQVVGEFPFLSKSEISLLNRLCVLATHYKRFRNFIDRYKCRVSQLSTEEEENEVRLENGLYLSAFCSGLDKVLAKYREALLRLEEHILDDPTLTICHIQHMLEQYHSLFHAMGHIIDKIETERYHGCRILDLLHSHWMCGQPNIKEAVQNILFACHSVMYHQLTTWLLHGMLLDQHGEFFIHQTKEPATPQEDGEGEESLGLGSISKSAVKHSLDITSSDYSEARFTINASMLPSYIPLRIAEKILFSGESVQMFENRKQSSASSVQDIDPVLGDNEGRFVTKLSKLRQQPVFIVQHFEGVVDEIRACVAQHLWKLVVEEHNLMSELQTLKDFFLLGRGELFLAFIDQAQSLLCQLPHTGMEHYVNIAFQQAAHKVLFDNEEVLSRFRLTIPSKEATGPSPRRLPLSKHSGESGWHVLGMSCSVQWPVHILFTPSALERYNRLFQFLLGLKMVQLELNQCWLHQMQRKHQKQSMSETAIWQLRSHMAFFVDNLQYYLQVDVLDAQFSLLQSKIQSTQDFEAVRLAHDQFLSSLLAQCFLLTKPVHHCLKEMQDLCHSFSVLILQTSEFTGREFSQVDKIAQGFNHQSSFLFKILSGVKANQSSPHLTQLLLRLDFNRYYSNAEGAIASLLPAS